MKVTAAGPFKDPHSGEFSEMHKWMTWSDLRLHEQRPIHPLPSPNSLLDWWSLPCSRIIISFKSSMQFQYPKYMMNISEQTYSLAGILGITSTDTINLMVEHRWGIMRRNTMKYPWQLADSPDHTFGKFLIQQKHRNLSWPAWGSHPQFWIVSLWVFPASHSSHPQPQWPSGSLHLLGLVTSEGIQIVHPKDDTWKSMSVSIMEDFLNQFWIRPISQ